MNGISVHLLRGYAFTNPNRGENGEPKIGWWGKKGRVVISSACEKNEIRERWGHGSYRTSHLQDLLENICLGAARDGIIKDDEVEKYGPILCEEVGGCNWERRASKMEAKKAEKKAGKKTKTEDSSEETEEKSDTEKKDPVLSIPPEAVAAISDAVFAAKAEYEEIMSQDNEEAKKTSEEAIRARKIREALDHIPVPANEAFFGTMTTSGTLKSIDSATRYSYMFSIDEYCPENHYCTAGLSISHSMDEDSFYGSYFKDFNAQQTKNNRAQGIFDEWVVSAVMYGYNLTDVDQLRKNLSMNVNGSDRGLQDIVIREIMKDSMAEYHRIMVEAVPGAKKTSMNSSSPLALMYFECIKEGNCTDASSAFEKLVRYDEEKSITEQGIERMLGWIRKSSMNNGRDCRDITRYVLLDGYYSDYEEAFEKIGVTVIHSFEELDVVIRKETERLYA